jgi:glycosyltransferase involved in cell wall biosynthesis
MRIPCQVYPPRSGASGSGSSAIIFNELTPPVPLVSALMVTRGSLDLVRCAVSSFRAQTWPNRELVVVCDAVTPELRDFISGANERLIEAPLGLTLGHLRNVSIAHSLGEYVVQWDDDDLYDPNRISIAVRALLRCGVSAVFMRQWLIWWQSRDLLALSGRRIWEGSMLARREAVPVYPSMSKSEDSALVDMLTRLHSYALIDAPTLYCYRITGENTWSEQHFEALLAQGSQHFERQEMAKLLKAPCFGFA